MISAKVKIPNSLKIKLSKYHIENNTKFLVNEVSEETLRKVKAYGIGTAGGNTNPTGGAPVWQGKVGDKLGHTGHYRGYLSDSHYIKRVNNTHAQIVSSADFVDGVINGYSTNWFDSQGNPRTFPPNPYHKRAVDEMYREGFQEYWNRVTNGINGKTKWD